MNPPSLWSPTPLVASLGVVLLMVGLVAIYQPSLAGPYVFDDVGALSSPGLLDTFPPSMPWWRAETRPVVMWSFAIERHGWNAGPTQHRLGNLFLHAVATLLLFELVRRLTLINASGTGPATRQTHREAVILAGCGAVLWAVHPLNSQAIAYVIQRCESLMGLFFFGYLLCIVMHAQSNRRSWLVWGCVCFVLGLWSKTVMITAVLVGPMIDRAFLSSGWRDVMSARGWLYVPPAFAALIAVATLLPGILRGDANVGFGGEAPPVMPYLAGQADVLFRYFGMSLFPIGLNLDHGFVAPQPWQKNLPQMLAAATLFFSGIVAGILGRWHLAFFVLTPLLILAPSSSFVPTADLMVEHRVYVPLACLCVGLVFALREGATRLKNNLPTRRVWDVGLVVAISIPLILAFSMVTWIRAHDYRTASTIWFKSLLSNPVNARAAQNLASVAGSELPPGALINLYAQALQFAEQSGYPTRIVLGRIGEELIKAHRPEEAEAVLRKAIEQDPTPSELTQKFYSPSERAEIAAHRIVLALALGRQGEPVEALDELNLAFQIDDSSPFARAIAADFYVKLDRPAEAIPHFERALELRPNWPEVEMQLNEARQQRDKSVTNGVAS